MLPSRLPVSAVSAVSAASVVSLVLGALVAGAVTTANPAEARSNTPYVAPSWQGVLTVSNFSGATVTLFVDGQAPRTLPANQTYRMSVNAGQPRVRATYRQFGNEYTLQSIRMNVVAGRSTYLALSPDTQGRLQVRNLYTETATVLVNGRAVAALSGGESRVLSVPVGPIDLALTNGSRTLQSTRMTIAAMAEPTWTIQPPPVGDLVVLNPLPIPIELICDRGMVRQVAAYGRTEYQGLSLGSFHLTARRITGEVIDDERASIQAGRDSTWRVDVPTNGLVEIESQHWIPVTVRVDGRLLATILPHQESRLSVPLGWHDLQIVDVQSHVLLDRWVEVDPFEASDIHTGVSLPPRTGPVSSVGGSRGRSGDDDGYGRDDRDGAYIPYGEVVSAAYPDSGYQNGATGTETAGSGCHLPATK